MDLQILGGVPLKGNVRLSGYKNSAVATIPAALLTEEEVHLENVPDIKDVRNLLKVLDQLEIDYDYNAEKSSLRIDPGHINPTYIRDVGLSKMRGSMLLFVPLILRMKELEIGAAIGGCTLGIRQVDTFFDNLEAFGFGVKNVNDSLTLNNDNYRAASIWQDETSVTSTETAIMAAVLAPGRSVIYNAACEPQVQDLCNMLNKMGAKISGIGSNQLVIEGVDKLHGCSFTLLDDYYELGTYLSISALTGNGIVIQHNIEPDLLKFIFEIYDRFGIHTETIKNDELWETRIKETDFKIFKPRTGGIYHMKAAPWPGFPVDLLPILLPVALRGKSPAILHNWMYEAGLNWSSELLKFGANLVVADPHRVVTYPSEEFKPAMVEAPYIIRAVIALIAMGLSIKGRSTVLNVDAAERGYPNFFKKLESLGAELKVVNIKK